MIPSRTSSSHIAIPQSANRFCGRKVQVTAGRFHEDLCFDAGEAVEASIQIDPPITPGSQ